MKRIGLIQHEIETPPGTALPWLKFRGFFVDHRQMHLGHSIPRPDEVDDLVICGGSMNVDEESIHPWLRDEKKLIESVLKKGGRVVGLCLGSQLTADVLGAKVGRYKDWEAGWHPVNLRVQPGLAGFEAPKPLMAFHYHRYSFQIPKDAVRIASNDWCENQAYLWKNQALCFQFHPETDLEWNRQCALEKDLPTTGQWQSSDEILKNGAIYQPKLQRWFESTLEGFLINRR